MLSRHRSRAHVPSGSTTTSLIVDLSEEQFIAELAKLRGVSRASFISQPRLDGRPVSLVKLYNEVALRGGSKCVTSLSLWDDVASALSLTPDCVNIGQAVKSIFQNYLESYERLQRLLDGQANGEVSQAVEIDLVTNNDTALSLQVVENHLRHRWNLSTDLIEAVEYRALLLALESGLPNELDYSINSILLVSSQPNGFDLSRCPQILSLMLSTVGIYSTGPCSYRLLKDVWRSQCHRDFDKFWRGVVPTKYGRQFLNPDVFYHPRLRVDPGSISSEPEYSYPLTFRDTMTYHDVEGFRVQLVAMVLRNLVVTPCANSLLLSQEPDVLRFVCLCIYSAHTALHQLGLDILAYLHFPVVGPLNDVLANLLPELLTSQDRVDACRGLLILRNLCEALVQTHQGSPGSVHTYPVEASSRNVDFLTQRLLPRRLVIGRIVQLACLRDLHVLVLALDALFALSTQGSALCDSLVDQGEEEDGCTDDCRLVAILVGYLTFEAQSFGSEGLIRIRVVQVPGSNTTVNTPPQQSNSTQRRILEKLVPIAAMPPPSPAKKSIDPPQSVAATTSGLLLSPMPQPHAGCYAVPAPVTTTTSMAKAVSAPPRVQIVTTLQDSSVPTLVSTAEVSFPTNLEESTGTQQLQPVPLQSMVIAPRTPVLPIVVAAPKPMGVATPSTTNGKQVLTPTAATTAPVDRRLSSSATATALAPAKQLLQSSSSASPSLINTLPKPYPDAPTDKREFATFWLNKNYQVHPQASFPRVQIYADYQKAHQAQFGSSSGGALSAGEFHAMVKTVFPPVDQVKVLVPNGNVEIHYNKLKHVDAPEPLEQTLGVQHMLGTCLASQNATAITTSAAGAPKTIRKRSAVDLIETPSSGEVAPKQARLVEDAGKPNGDGGNGPPATPSLVTVPTPAATTILNGSTTAPHPIKLLTTAANPAGTFIDGVIPVSNNGSIEIAANGIQLQQPVIAASAIVIPSMDGKRVLNGFKTTTGDGNVGTTTTATVIDPSQGLVQLRTFLPTVPAASPVTAAATALASNGNATNNSIPKATLSQCRPSLVMQSSAAAVVTAPPPAPSGVVITGGAGGDFTNAATGATLTCLGTFMATASSVAGGGVMGTGAPQQVYVYSIAPPPLPNGGGGGGVGTTTAIIPTLPSHGLINVSAAASPALVAQQLPQQMNQVLRSAPVSTAAGMVCHWTDCKRIFSSVEKLFAHSYVTHFIPIKDQKEVTCRWSGCRESSLRRAPLSLLEHLREHHCNPGRCLSSNSRSVSQVDVGDDITASLTTLATSKPSLTATRTALADKEFRQHLNADFAAPQAASVTEGPVTKHVRLTAALILLNLVTYSSTARSQLRAYESLLCDLALSGSEASSTLIKCLTLLSSSASEFCSPSNRNNGNNTASHAFSNSSSSSAHLR